MVNGFIFKICQGREGESSKVVCYRFEGATLHAVALYLPGNSLELRVVEMSLRTTILQCIGLLSLCMQLEHIMFVKGPSINFVTLVSIKCPPYPLYHEKQLMKHFVTVPTIHLTVPWDTLKIFQCIAL